MDQITYPTFLNGPKSGAKTQTFVLTREWSPRDEAILRTYVPARSPEALADFFGCSVECVRRQAAKLGLEWS